MSSKPGIVECYECVFWAGKRSADIDRGACRRHAPVMAMDMSEGSYTAWPTTKTEDGCGDGREFFSIWVANERDKPSTDVWVAISEAMDETYPYTDSVTAMERWMRSLVTDASDQQRRHWVAELKWLRDIWLGHDPRWEARPLKPFDLQAEDRARQDNQYGGTEQ